MTRRAFRPAISLLLLLAIPTLSGGGASAPHTPQTTAEPHPNHKTPITNIPIHQSTNTPVSCHDNYSPESFEEADDDLQEFIDEYFHDTHIPFFPNKQQLHALGLIPGAHGVYLKPHALTTAGGNRRYPVTPGLWKAVDLGSGVWQYHLLIREPQRLTETEAFSTLNDLLGEPFADYDNPAYGMLLQPEEIRRRYGGRFFTITVHIYGVRDDATDLPRTVSDVILTDYTPWIGQYRRCRAQGYVP